jgi:gamma-resorcylate decarboxylase
MQRRPNGYVTRGTNESRKGTNIVEGKIALEEHFSTALYKNYWNAKGEESRNGREFTQEIQRRLFDPDLCLREMDFAGIEFCVMSLTSPGVQSLVDKQEAITVARDANDYAATFIRNHPDRFSAFAAVALQDPGNAADELERAVSELGFKGALINGYTNIGADEAVLYLDEQPVWEFWERVSKLNVPVYLHPREPLPSQTRAIRGYPELFGSAWAFGYETASHAIRLMLSGLFDAFPNLQVVLGHLGEGLPYLLPRMQHRLDKQRDGERGARAKRRASYYFRSNFWLTTSGHHHSQPLLEAMEEIGDDRVLFSVDYPYEQMKSAAHWFDELLIANELKVKIGRDNANTLLQLGLSAFTVSSGLGFGS